jgi:hypothetical protein
VTYNRSHDYHKYSERDKYQATRVLDVTDNEMPFTDNHSTYVKVSKLNLKEGMRMVHLNLIEAQLSQLGIRTSRWFKAEIHELPHVLMEREKIIGLVTGRYYGGFAIMVTTDQRVLIIDKKVLFLTVEDIRYDMIAEVDYNARLFDATVTLFTVNKQHHFTSYKNKQQLRVMVSYIQQRVMEIRHYNQNLSQAPQTQPRQELPPAYQGPTGEPAYSAPAPIAASAGSAPDPVYSLPEPHVTTVPSAEVPQVVGAAAIHSTPWMNVNPYTKGSFVTRRQSSRWGR